MSRRLKVETKQMGFIELYLIYDNEGVWEEHWRPLQSAPVFESAIASISREGMEQALIGWTKPLVDLLGPAPKGRLLKLPEATRECASRQRCPFYEERRCGHLLNKMPWCYVPDGVEGAAQRLLGEVITLWREGVYVIVVREPGHA